MKTFYFTFGQSHVHSVNEFTWDKDVVCAIQAESEIKAREIMASHFGMLWGNSYEKCPDMKYFPRGIKNLNF